MHLSVFEHDLIAPDGTSGTTGWRVPTRVFAWLETQSLSDFEGRPRWLHPATCNGKFAVKIANYSGVVRTPCGFQIEILPKTGQVTSAGEARRILLSMLSCLGEFRHIRLDDAHLLTRSASLIDIFITQFLASVESLVRQGIRGGYTNYQEDLPVLRGKLMFQRHLRISLVRRDRFAVEHDDFRYDRPENRLILTALERIPTLTNSISRKRQGRLLTIPFDGVPSSHSIANDIGSVRIERDMQRYYTPLAWAKLILQHLSPLTGSGNHIAPSLLYPTETLFEAYVFHHLSRQLPSGHALKKQVKSKYLTVHNGQPWFQLKPDMLHVSIDGTRTVLDTKWKLLDATKSDSQSKYGLSQADFYQLYAYGNHYLGTEGNIILIYPKTDAFSAPLPLFTFPDHPKMNLIVLPFCLSKNVLMANPFLPQQLPAPN